MSNSIKNEKALRNIKLTLALLSSVINETEPVEPDFEPDWEFIFNLTEKHNVDNTIFYAVEKLKNKPEPALYKKWMDLRNKCIHRNMIQRREYAAVCSAFDKNGIEYMPVKGFDIGSLYPTEDSRFMSDLDILIKHDRKPAEDALMNMGYTEKRGKVDYDKGYMKPPFMYIELHNSILPRYSPFFPYFENIFTRSIKTDNSYKMTGIDFYLYVIVHTHKHYFQSGTGIRSVMDLYLINKKLLPKLDTEKINSELKTLGLKDFTKMISEISEKWFKNEDYSSFSDDEIYIISSGTYGTQEQSVKNKLQNQSKAKFVFSRMFPPKSNMLEFYPKLQKYPVLFPFYYIQRLFKGLFFKRKTIKNEYTLLKKNGNK